ncbi:hypothetical protein ABPG75_005191 [Micractinium tetrahymenae]
MPGPSKRAEGPGCAAGSFDAEQQAAKRACLDKEHSRAVDNSPGAPAASTAAAGRAAQRQAAAAPCTPATALPPGPPAGPAACLPDSPMHLLRVDGLEPWANEGFLGASFGQLVCGDVRGCLATSYNLHARWLFSACPALRQAARLVLVFNDKDWRGRNKQVEHAVEAACMQGRCTLHVPPLLRSEPAFRQHGKLFVVEYSRGVRVIISSCNLEFQQAHCKTQALSFQDFPRKDEHSPESSDFERDLRAYLAALQLPGPDWAWLSRLLSRHDFSRARAALLGSVPGSHSGADLERLGHPRLAALLRREPWAVRLAGEAPRLVVQAGLGAANGKDGYLAKQLLPALSAGVSGPAASAEEAPEQQLAIVWPTVDDVRQSQEGWFGSGSLSGAEHVQELQPFLQRWDAGAVGRQRAMPHTRLYWRHAASGEPLWAAICSGNLCKGHWGEVKQDGSLKVKSFELGALLLPSLERAYQQSRWRGFSATGDQPFWPRPGLHAGMPVRYSAWTRGQPQEPALVGGQLVVPLPLPHSPPAAASMEQAALPAAMAAAAEGPVSRQPEDVWWGQQRLGTDWLDCHGLPYAVYAGAVQRRYSMQEGQDWATDVVGVLADAWWGNGEG